MLDAATSTTDYARLSPRQARAVLGLIALVVVVGLAVTLSPLASSNLRPHPQESGDVALYRAEVDRIRQGEGYYRAAAAELTARGYPTLIAFNWRTPLPMWLLGKLPAESLGRMLLGGMALALVLMAFAALMREENVLLTLYTRNERHAERDEYGLHEHHAERDEYNKAMLRPVGCALLLSGPLLPAVLGDLFVMPVLWAGVLIGLSVCAYGIKRPQLGAALGLAAVFFRELALPYCLLCAVLAWRRGRRGELALWTLGLTAWLAFFGWHCWRVSELAAAGARAHRESWIQFGGAGFVISTVQMNAYLLLLPQWVTALYLAAALVGFAGWSTPLGTRIGLTACLYLAAFAFVGQSFNQYWGTLIAPLLCFGVAQFPASLRDLRRAAMHATPCRIARTRKPA